MPCDRFCAIVEFIPHLCVVSCGRLFECLQTLSFLRGLWLGIYFMKLLFVLSIFTINFVR